MAGAQRLKDEVGFWLQDAKDRVKYVRHKDLDAFLDKELAKYANK
jgi:hypothetical protein